MSTGRMATWLGRAMTAVKRYGFAGVVVWIVAQWFLVAASFILVRFFLPDVDLFSSWLGIDVADAIAQQAKNVGADAWIEWIGLSGSTITSFLLASALAKVFFPLRILITLFLAPRLANVWSGARHGTPHATPPLSDEGNPKTATMTQRPPR